MFQPARLNSAIVASCKLPLGIPRRSLGIGTLLRFSTKRNGLGEAAHRSFVTHEAIAFHFDTEQERVVVAVGGSGDDAQAIAAALALHPQLLARAAPEGNEAGLQCFCIAGGV